MLLIFDLDDTLIQTTHFLTSVRLRRAVKKMVAHGLVLSNSSSAVDELFRFDSRSKSAKESLIRFVSKHGGDERHLEIGLNEVYESEPKKSEIVMSKGADEVLYTLSKSHKIAVVTVGIRERQLKKLEMSGIDFSLFCKIIVCDTEKSEAYQKVVAELKFHPSEVLVCGDKAETDLAPAKAMGYTTVRMVQGRGGLLNSDSKDVDFTITELQQLQKIVYKDDKQ